MVRSRYRSMHQLQMVPTDGSQVPDGTQPLKHERNGMFETVGYQWHVIMRQSTQDAPDGQGATTTLIRDGAVDCSRWYSPMVPREHKWHVTMRQSTQNAPDGQGATTTLARNRAVDWCVSSRWYPQMVSREHQPVPDGTRRWYRVNTSGML